MYIFEIIIKKLKDLKKKHTYHLDQPEEEDPNIDCDSHVYLPLDSSKDYLACKNCGKIVRR